MMLSETVRESLAIGLVLILFVLEIWFVWLVVRKRK